MMKTVEGSLAGVGAVCLIALGASILGDNFRAVVPDRVYRSGQLSPEALSDRIRRHHLQSILNLRGGEGDGDWYRRELEVANRYGVDMRSLDLVPERLPSRIDVVALIEDLENLPEPILIHCSAGADRTGFASVIARMAKEGASFDDARSELSVRYGHIPFGPASEIGRFFDLYDAYRKASGARSDWKSFERWARELYVPYVYRAAITARGIPDEVAPSARMDVEVRMTNESPGEWAFTEDDSSGIKVGVKLRAPGGTEWIDYDRHGQIDRRVGSGESLEIEVPIWAPAAPGEYQLKIDLVDEHVTWFEDQGSEPLVRKLIVRR